MNKPLVASTDVVKLAAMECAASCVLTSLRIAGLDDRYFMLGYWHLTYSANVLMSGRNMVRNDLEYVYGIRKELVSGAGDRLMASLREGHMVLLYCRASRLPFFPVRMLGHEAKGFEHCILVYQYRQETGRFLVIDPIADYIGEMSLAELYSGSARENRFIYYSLAFPTFFQKPSDVEIFHRESANNFNQYTQEGLHTGGKAIDLFCRDLAQCAQWNALDRDAWIDQNNITITSIVKTRPIVWESFRALDVLSSEDIRTGAESIEAIVKLWTIVNFQLIKLKRNPDHATLALSIRAKLKAVRSAESAFLEFLYKKGRECVEI